MDRASDYHAYFPKMLRAPELETNEPAFVVVYAGQVEIGGLSIAPPPLDAGGNPVTRDPQPPTYSGVICVVTETMGATLYSDVDTSK
jgi:hypothetical protein